LGLLNGDGLEHLGDDGVNVGHLGDGDDEVLLFIHDDELIHIAPFFKTGLTFFRFVVQ